MNYNRSFIYNQYIFIIYINIEKHPKYFVMATIYFNKKNMVGNKILYNLCGQVLKINGYLNCQR